jgi:hypothetical protein
MLFANQSFKLKRLPDGALLALAGDPRTAVSAKLAILRRSGIVAIQIGWSKIL